jgi:hypothetical protein
MKDMRTRILSANYGKLFRMLIASGICIFLIGGGASAIMLHTLDANAFAKGSQPQLQQPGEGPGEMNGGQQGNGNLGDGGQQGQPGNMPGNNGGQFRGPDGHHGQGSMGNNGDMQAPPQGNDSQGNFGGHGMHHDSFLHRILSNSQISIATKIVVLATTVLGILWAILTWLTIVCYLYRSSTFSGMNRVLWTVLGAIGSVLTLIAFFIVRSFLKARCENCGSWQDNDQTFCTTCGSMMRRDCPGCGTSVAQNAAFCPSCGRAMTADKANSEDSNSDSTVPAGADA